MLKIGIFSILSRISVRMLRRYDEIGLLTPQCTDRFTNYRYYSEDQLPTAQRIAALRDMGFGLADISALLRRWEEPEAVERALRQRREELEAEARAAAERLRLLETAMEHLRKEGTAMEYNVTLKELPERQVASVRQVIPAYDQEGLLWKILMEETAEMELQPGEPCYTLAIFHDGEHKEADVDVEIQKSVKGDYRDTAHVKFKTVPPILMASAVYKGSYDKISEVNESVARWVRDSGYEFAGLSFCIYHVSPYETRDPSELVTEVCYPVRKK